MLTLPTLEFTKLELQGNNFFYCIIHTSERTTHICLNDQKTMTPSPETSTKLSIASSTPNGKTQQAKFLLSVNGASDDQSSEPNSPPGMLMLLRCRLWYRYSYYSFFCVNKVEIKKLCSKKEKVWQQLEIFFSLYVEYKCHLRVYLLLNDRGNFLPFFIQIINVSVTSCKVLKFSHKIWINPQLKVFTLLFL